MLKVKIWNRFEVKVAGERLTMEVKRLRYHEAVPLMLALSEAFEARGSLGPESTSDEKLNATRRFMEKLPEDTVGRVFRDYIRNVQGLETEEGPATTGEALYAVADGDCLLDVLLEVQRLAFLGSKEADFLSSRSTPPSTPAPDPSVSDAGSTASEDGQQPSTATPIPAEREPSIAGG